MPAGGWSSALGPVMISPALALRRLSAGFWDQTVLLRYKCAVCLELKFVAVFSVLIGQRVVPGSAATPSMAPVTAVFRSALPPLGIHCTRRPRGVPASSPTTGLPPTRCPQTPHTARLTSSRSFHPLLIPLEHARTGPADSQGLRHRRAPPALSSGARRRRAAAVGTPARARALPPGSPGPGPRRRAAWSGR